MSRDVTRSTARPPHDRRHGDPTPAAAQAGREIFLAGGNAVDAAVGAMLACCVAMPGSVGLGGYGGSMVAYLAREQSEVAIDFDSRAPLAYRPEVFAGDPSVRHRGTWRSPCPRWSRVWSWP